MTNTNECLEAGYVGWNGHNNLGDEAIYHAIESELDNIILKPSEFCHNALITLLGGGTILPFVFQNGSAYHFEERELNVAIGVGVAEPEFENKRRVILDIRQLCGRVGIDSNSVLNQLGLVGEAIKMGNRLPGVLLTGTYCHPNHYRQAGALLDKITVRGPRSKRVLESKGVDCEVVGDTALLLEPEEYHPNASTKIVVCLRKPGTGRKWTHDQAYVNHLVDFCNNLPKSVEKVFLPFQPSDIPFHRDVASQIDNATWKDYTSVVDVDAALNEIASAEVVIGEKLHANVFAACCFTPFISLGYAPKNQDFAASVGMEKFNIRITDVDTELLSERYTEARDIRVSRLRDRVEDYRNRLRNTLEEIDMYS